MQNLLKSERKVNKIWFPLYVLMCVTDELRTEQETTAHNDNIRRQADAQIKDLQIKVTYAPD